jgi:hypothetical protein
MSQNCQPRLPAEQRTFYSSNVADGELCFRHVQQGQVIGPLFRCESWPSPEAPSRLRVTGRIWNQSQLTKVLPTLFGAADGVGGMPTLAQSQRHAA